MWRETASLRLEYARERVRLTVTPYLNVGIHRLYDGFYSRDLVGGGIGEADVRLHRRVQLLVGTDGEGVGGSVENRITGEAPAVRSHADLSLYGQLTLRPLDRITVVLGDARALQHGLRLRVPLQGRRPLEPRARPRPAHPAHAQLPAADHPRAVPPVPDGQPRPPARVLAQLGRRASASPPGTSSSSCSVYRTEARDLIKYFGVWPAAEVVNIDHLVIWGVEGRVGVKRLGPHVGLRGG